MYLKSLIAHLSGNSTALRNEGRSEVYLYELVDKDVNQGVRNWGLLYHNLTNKYAELVYAVDHLDPSLDPLFAWLVIGLLFGIGVLSYGIHRGWTYEDFAKFFYFLRRILD